MDKRGSYIYEWPRPMVTVDAVVFWVSRGKVKLLLIKRRNEPFKGKWAVPGGFIGIDEELEDAISRELHEETGLTGVNLEQMHTFGKVGRDPRGRQITTCYIGVITKGHEKAKAGDDAIEAKWFDIDNLPKDLAFDHDNVTKFAVRHLMKYLADQAGH